MSIDHSPCVRCAVGAAAAAAAVREADVPRRAAEARRAEGPPAEGDTGAARVHHAALGWG